MLPRVPAEVAERRLVCIQQVAERLTQARHVDAPTRVAERQHEDVPHRPLPDKGNPLINDNYYCETLPSRRHTEGVTADRRDRTVC